MEEKPASKGKGFISKANPRYGQFYNSWSRQIVIWSFDSKRSKPANSDEDSDEIESPKKKWAKKKPPKKVKPKKPAKSTKLDTGLDLALDEELALHLLSSK